MKSEDVRLVCVMLALLFLSCSTKRIGSPDGGNDKSERDEQAKSNTAYQPSPVTGKYERLLEFGFLVPDNWKSEPAEYGLYLTHNAYAKGGVFLRVLYDKGNEYDPERTPSEEFGELLRKNVEKMVENQIGVNHTELVERKTLNINGLNTTVFHYSYSSKAQNGDAIEAFFHKDSQIFWMNGGFPYPQYTQLEPDIRRIIESVRKE